jgi:dihydrofolate synthase/folylpolyglutamate synthase
VLKDFLDNKPLYYDKIDYTRMPRVYESIKHHMQLPKIIHIVGTNAKGTTGRFLATALKNIGFSVGHYTSPHILKFNERIWLDGFDVSDEVLENAHKKLQSYLDIEQSNELSYFEYTTLLAMLVFESCEYVVLEAGLGGEHDATAVFEKIFTLVTPIAKDHEAFLGSTLKEIAQTKLNAIKNTAILAKQDKDVYEVAYSLGKKIYRYDELLDGDDYIKIRQISKRLSLVEYLEDYLALSISALKFLKLGYKDADFTNARLFGRLSKLGKNIIVDVGHNVLAAKSIKKSLSSNKYILIYNSYKDKNYKEILELLKPIILHVELIELEDDRIESPEVMEGVLDSLGLKHKRFEEIKQGSDYLVFGSFVVVEKFLKEYYA